jgi:TIR domain-containing protein
MAHLAKQGDPVRAFFIYSRKDKEIRDALESHLGGLKQSGRIKCFHDGELVAGQHWEPAILDELEKAQLILLLVSADSLNSPYCEKELSRALERHASGEARLIPILVRRVDWKGAPFAHIQLLPKNQIPVAK